MEFIDIFCWIALGIVLGMLSCAALINRALDEEKEAIYVKGYDKGFSAGKEAARKQIIDKINKTYGVGILFTDPEEKDTSESSDTIAE